MISFRNILAIGIFLFGTTYLWLTPAFIGKSATGTLWAAVQVLAYAAIIGFAVAAFGIFNGTDWWEPIAIGSAVIGMAAVILYWVGLQNVSGALNAAAVENIAIHFLGGAAIAALLVVHSAEQWIVGRL
jgi:hypothetical protein